MKEGDASQGSTMSAPLIADETGGRERLPSTGEVGGSPVRPHSRSDLTMLTPHFDSPTRVGTIGSAVFNLVNTILGGGILSVPYAFQVHRPEGLLFCCAIGPQYQMIRWPRGREREAERGAQPYFALLSRRSRHGGDPRRVLIAANPPGRTPRAASPPPPVLLQKSGVLFGFIAMCVVAFAAHHSVYALISCARRTGASSYAEVAEIAFGHRARCVRAAADLGAGGCGGAAAGVRAVGCDGPALRVPLTEPELELARARLRAGRTRAAEPNRTEPNRTEPNRTKPNRTKPNRTVPASCSRRPASARRYATMVLLILLTFLASLGYLILAPQLLLPVLEAFVTGNLSAAASVLIGAAIDLLTLPFCFLRTLDALKVRARRDQR